MLSLYQVISSILQLLNCSQLSFSISVSVQRVGICYLSCKLPLFSVYLLGNYIWVSVYWLSSLSFLFLFKIFEDRVNTCRLLSVQQLHNYSFLLCFIFRSWTCGRFFYRRIFLRSWEIDKVWEWILFLATRDIIWFDRRYLFRFRVSRFDLILFYQLFYIRVYRLHL